MLWCIGASSGWGVGCWELITHKDGARKVKARVVRGGVEMLQFAAVAEFSQIARCASMEDP